MNLSFVLPALRLNILETEKMLQFAMKLFFWRFFLNKKLGSVFCDEIAMYVRLNDIFKKSVLFAASPSEY